ncbi:protein kinase domain-containing protein [Brasilonema octagenarum]|uniref:non-specific serine/threonine protein kinase n=1 Tax=Brasilonema octagenarum UFV-OR1 TaxID=417115 RepID=A0ABX1M587_9CYAN|nr:serine/threonine protein kinase [Brasilonema octagenarum UFV-OR1]
MFHTNQNAVHCINSDCPRPYPQPWGNKFCHTCGAPLQLLDRYVPLQRLGSGGFAQIYTVWDQKTQTEKVLKVLMESSPKALELFAQEATVLKSLRHPGVPRVDADGYFSVEMLSVTTPQSNLKPYQFNCLVMEKIHGQTLEEVFQQYPQGCPQEWILNWLVQAVEILQELHTRKIIHRDIKPSNLMLRIPQGSVNKGGTRKDQLVLIDFGGAKQYSSNLFGLKPSSTRLYSSGYSPPEQVIGGIIGPAADFYALGRTMIEMLTGKSLSDLENPVSGELLWRKVVNVNSQLADLLDEMVQEDGRSRPANAAIVQKRLEKISRISPHQGIKSQIQQSFAQGFGQAKGILVKVEDSVGQALTTSAHAVGQTTLFILKAIFKIFFACLDTFWTILLTGVGASFGTIGGFVLASQTTIDEQITKFISDQLPELSLTTPAISGLELLLFAGAGLGTAWGLTLARGFGQKRRFFVTSIMGIISYGFAWLVLQLFTPQQGGERLLGLILAAVSLLTISLGLRSHHIVHAIVAAFGTAVVFAVFVLLGFPTNIFDFLSLPNWNELWLPVTFFGFVGVFLSFFLGVSHYLIVPGLRFLGWR